jgi:hypothetical protein
MIKGVLRAEGYSSQNEGKQFLGAAIEGADGTVWIVSYSELSPFHALDGHDVIASGELFEPKPWAQRLIAWKNTIGDSVQPQHFNVRTMRAAQPTPEMYITEIRASQEISGRLERDPAKPEWRLSFVADDGMSFVVVNDPPGIVLGRKIKVLAYPVELAQPFHGVGRECVWIECSCSSDDIWKWRERKARK